MTNRQAQLLAHLRSLPPHGPTPSYAELSIALGLKSKSSIHRLVEALIRDGHLERTNGHRHLHLKNNHNDGDIALALEARTKTLARVVGALDGILPLVRRWSSLSPENGGPNPDELVTDADHGNKPKPRALIDAEEVLLAAEAAIGSDRINQTATRVDIAADVDLTDDEVKRPERFNLDSLPAAARAFANALEAGEAYKVTRMPLPPRLIEQERQARSAVRNFLAHET